MTVEDVLAADAWARAAATETDRRNPMTGLFYLLGVVIFVVAILASIGLHELGHMIPAKKFGGKVTQYFIGFGPTVWSKQVGETEYGVKAIPLGGYVKIVGMLPPGAERARRRGDRRRAGQPGRQGPQVQHRHVHPADLRRPRGRVGDDQARGLRPRSSTRWRGGRRSS